MMGNGGGPQSVLRCLGQYASRRILCATLLLATLGLFGCELESQEHDNSSQPEQAFADESKSTINSSQTPTIVLNTPDMVPTVSENQVISAQAPTAVVTSGPVKEPAISESKAISSQIPTAVLEDKPGKALATVEIPKTANKKQVDVESSDTKGVGELEETPQPEIVSQAAELTDSFSFEQNYLDPIRTAKWMRAGDMDSDGDLDLVAGGSGQRSLAIFENDGSGGGWRSSVNLGGNNGPGGNGAVLYDVDTDGDLDVVGARNYNDAGWWENPGGKLVGAKWRFHVISDESWLLHDIILVDLDRDGKAEEFVVDFVDNYWNSNIKIKWFRPGTDVTKMWESHTIEASRNEGVLHGHAGLDAGDLDKDGDVDLAFSNGWYEAPDNPTSGNWVWHAVANIYGISNTLFEDMDGDKDLDLVITGGHHGQGAFWMENSGNPKSGTWTQHNISAVSGDLTKRHKFDAGAPEVLHHPECLDLADLDADGDLDVVTCDLYFGQDAGEPEWDDEAMNLYVYENMGDSLTWKRQNIAPKSHPNHLLRLIDINADGKLDIISDGANYANVSYYENMGGVVSPPPTNTPVATSEQTAVPSSTPTSTAPDINQSIFLPLATSS